MALGATRETGTTQKQYKASRGNCLKKCIYFPFLNVFQNDTWVIILDAQMIKEPAFHSLMKSLEEQLVPDGDAGDRTRGLSHAKRTRYHCATSPADL